MLLTRTVTKKILETIVHETFNNFGRLSSSSLLDSLKLLGFHYATNAGISINIEDLKTPNTKKEYIETANEQINVISQQWQQGLVSDTERFQTIIDSWNAATEYLKDRIVSYYQNFDPANNLYIMAFSGARGNMSQVRQLVGMRGLMSDQQGNIIDLPIQANFREGLSSIDYIISSYGARKGIVDTALKTADSGYLTRRLIYVAQDLVIREFNCKTNEGILIEIKKDTTIKNLIGRTLQEVKSPHQKFREYNDKLLTEENLNFFKYNSPLILNIRSSLTCKSHGSICQKCYGWDLAQGRIISLGEAVGIIAAQSIGEPGTQLTMRTFHTGGIFSGELLKQIEVPFSGKIYIPKSLKTIPYRTSHGMNVLKLQQETTIKITNWDGKEKTLFLNIGSFLYINKSQFVKKGALIAEYSTQTLIPGMRRLKPIYTTIAGEIRFENLMVRKMLRDKRTVKVNQDDGILWIAAGKIFVIPKEAKFLFPKDLSLNKPIAKLKISTPFAGIISFKNQATLTITNNDKVIDLKITDVLKGYKNCNIKFSLIVKNYQYVDQNTVLGYIEIIPKFRGKIYSTRQKISKHMNSIFVISEDDVWKINSDHSNNFDFFTDKKALARIGNKVNTNSKFSRSGFFLKRDGFKMIFQNAIPIFLSRGTILNYKQGDFVLEKEVFATLVNYPQQTEDIVQGLPKIEELIEARKPKIKAFLASRPGILLNESIVSDSHSNDFIRTIKKNIINCTYKSNKEDSFILTTRSKRKQDKQIIHVGHSIYLKDDMIVFNNQIFKIFPVPEMFKPELKPKKKNEFIFKTEQEEVLLTHSKLSFSTWELNKIRTASNVLYKLKDGNLKEWLTLDVDNKVYRNIKHGDLIIQTAPNNFVFLEYLNPISEYEIPLTSKLLLNPGTFVDIGEPLTEGTVDIHELLNIFFKYHSIIDGTMKGTIRSLTKFQLLLVNSIQAIYQSQGVGVSSKHIEIVVRQMTSRVVIRESGDTPLLPGELVKISLINEIYNALKNTKVYNQYQVPKYEPLLTSSTNSSLSKDGFLSAAGFQETKKVLTRAAIEGSTDWLRSLKECIIIGRLIPAGSSFLNYKNYLDTVYLFKN
jgi:hypothetical protein